MKLKIVHDRPGCIGCGACAAIAPEHWEMDDDGKSNIIDGKRQDNGSEEKTIDESQLEDNKEAAESCPVNVIHIFEDDKKLI